MLPGMGTVHIIDADTSDTSVPNGEQRVPDMVLDSIVSEEAAATSLGTVLSLLSCTVSIRAS